jgi:L-ascorbate metabolism protein UlaG (beta-lactamase superfamily)
LGSVAPTASGLVDLAAPGDDVLRLVYLGSGGWIMERGEDMVMTGPLFTNPSLLATGLAPVRSDTALVDEHMSRYDVSRARAILVGHAHYDHLMDVPRTATRHAPAARIVGGRTVANTLGTWSGLVGRVDVVDDSAGDHREEGRWLRYGGVRVMALRSHHGPHFAGYTLYRGTMSRPLAREPELAADWVDGETYAFLIDFLAAGDSVAFRVFYQDAVAEPPFGLAPDSLIAERRVDVAILVPSTFEEVPWHPEASLENLNPRRVLLGHWEDFFVPVTDPMRPSPMTDHREFDRRLERVFDGEWWRPERWTEFRFSAR